MKRTPLRRTPMKRAKSRGWNTSLAARSKKRSAYLVTSHYSARSAGARGKRCRVRSAVCTGTAQGLHHVLGRATAGSLELAERLGWTLASCNACNSWVEREGRAWAEANGLRISVRLLAAARARYGDNDAAIADWLRGAVDMNAEAAS